MTVCYFISDVHLGIPNLSHQKKLILFLKDIQKQAKSSSIKIRLFILGDLFEFWTTMALVAHKSLIRNHTVIRELIALKKIGVKIYFLSGNHDFQLKDIFEYELGADILNTFQEMLLDGKRVFIGHGEQINHSLFSRITLKIYHSKIPVLLFSLMGFRLANLKSRILSNLSSRLKFQTGLDAQFHNFACNKIKQGYDIVILAHTHKPRLKKIDQGYYLNTGDWIQNFSYGILSQGKISLERF